MIYREFLVMRKAVLWFLGSALALSLFAFGMSAACNHKTTNGSLSDLLVPVGYVVALFAAVFGVALGNASREPARVMWTLPESRLRSALGVIGVDLAGLVVALFGLLAVVIASVYVYALLGLADVKIVFTLSWLTLARMLGFVFAVYGWSALSGMCVRRVAYAGIGALPAMVLLPILAQPANAFGALMRPVTVIDPFVVVSAFHRGSAQDLLSVWYSSWITEQSATLILFAIALAAFAIATTLWKRAEILNI